MPKGTFTDKDLDALKDLLVEDLLTIVRHLSPTDPLPPASVRTIATPILRKWLIDGRIHDIARLSGWKVSFPVLDTSSIAETINDTQVKLFICGGIRLNGQPIQGIYVSDSPPKTSPDIPIDKMSLIELRPAKFIEQRRVFFEGKWFNLGDIVRFAANKYGGIHYENNRTDDQEALLTASKYFLLGDPTHRGRVELIEPVNGDGSLQMILPLEAGHNWNCIHIELLAAASALVHVRFNDQQLLDFESLENEHFKAENDNIRR